MKIYWNMNTLNGNIMKSQGWVGYSICTENLRTERKTIHNMIKVDSYNQSKGIKNLHEWRKKCRLEWVLQLSGLSRCLWCQHANIKTVWGIPISIPLPIQLTDGESNKRWPRCLGRITQVGERNGVPGFWLCLIKPQSSVIWGVNSGGKVSLSLSNSSK